MGVDMLTDSDSPVSGVSAALGECRRQLSGTEQAIKQVTVEWQQFIEEA